MNVPRHHRLSLKVVAVADLLPAVTQFADTSAVYSGLGERESLAVRLAAEEIFSYLCHRVCGGAPVEIASLGSLSHVRLEFRFNVSALEMSALNLTSAVSLESDDDLADMGLVIASRTVDRLYIATEPPDRVVLAVEQDKAYPPAPDAPRDGPSAQGALSVALPEGDAVGRLAMQIGAWARDPLLPAFFRYPGRVADMLAADHCRALIVQDSAGVIVGAILSRSLTDRIVEVFSPCVFSSIREREIAEMLVDGCVSGTARTRAVGLVNLTGFLPGVQTGFEPLGSLTYRSPEGSRLIGQASFRLLHEDPGAQVWTHGALTEYLRGEYQRLFLARDIRLVSDLGAARAGRSIFATEMRRERSEAYLRPLWPGDDLAENLAKHVALCKRESLGNITFALDLGVSWQASLVPVLLANRFEPRVIVPFAGQSDLVLFQHDGP